MKNNISTISLNKGVDNKNYMKILHTDFHFYLFFRLQKRAQKNYSKELVYKNILFI